MAGVINMRLQVQAAKSARCKLPRAGRPRRAHAAPQSHRCAARTVRALPLLLPPSLLLVRRRLRRLLLVAPLLHVHLVRLLKLGQLLRLAGHRVVVEPGVLRSAAAAGGGQWARCQRTVASRPTQLFGRQTLQHAMLLLCCMHI